MRPRAFFAQPLLLVGFVFLIVPFEEIDLRIALEGEHVRGDAIKEPAVVRDYHHAAGELEQRIFESAQRLDIEIVRGLVEEQYVAAF